MTDIAKELEGLLGVWKCFAEGHSIGEPIKASDYAAGTLGYISIHGNLGYAVVGDSVKVILRSLRILYRKDKNYEERVLYVYKLDNSGIFGDGPENEVQYCSGIQAGAMQMAYDYLLEHGLSAIGQRETCDNMTLYVLREYQRDTEKPLLLLGTVRDLDKECMSNGNE